jgi:hypothetical protein
LGRLLAYELANSEPLLTRINMLIQMADWDLLFEQRQSALDIYERTYEFLKQAGTPQAAIDEIFSPKTPVVLPTFLPHPFATEEPQQSMGYVVGSQNLGTPPALVFSK